MIPFTYRNFYQAGIKHKLHIHSEKRIHLFPLLRSYPAINKYGGTCPPHALISVHSLVPTCSAAAINDLPLSNCSKASAYWSIFDVGCFSALLIGDGDLDLDLLEKPRNSFSGKPPPRLPSSTASLSRAKSLWLNASSQLGYSCLATGGGGGRAGLRPSAAPCPAAPPSLTPNRSK